MNKKVDKKALNNNVHFKIRHALNIYWNNVEDIKNSSNILYVVSNNVFTKKISTLIWDATTKSNFDDLESELENEISNLGKNIENIIIINNITKLRLFNVKGKPCNLVNSKEFFRLLIDFQPYIYWFTNSYKNNIGVFKDPNLIDNYVKLEGSFQSNNSVERSSLKKIVDNWIYKSDNNFLLLLGEYGSGKTSFVRNYIYEYFDSNTEPFPIPILINLRNYKDSFGLQQIITDSLINHYGVTITSFAAIELLCESGDFLFILDGFDEMPKNTNPISVAEAFKQIFILAELGAKVLLTCRTNFFNSQKAIYELIQSAKAEFVKDDGSTDEVNFNKHGDSVYLAPMDSGQIRQFIERRIGDQANDFIEQINSIHDLSDLSTRPVLLDMIVRTLPVLMEKNESVNSAALYGEYTNQWTIRDDWRVILPKELRTEICAEIAFMMHTNRSYVIEYSTISRLIRENLRIISNEEDVLEKFENDIKTCSFLSRDAESEKFSFAHKSFIEYFVSKKIIQKIFNGDYGEKREGNEEVRISDIDNNSSIWSTAIFDFNSEIDYLFRLRVHDLYARISLPDSNYALSKSKSERYANLLTPHTLKLGDAEVREHLSGAINKWFEQQLPTTKSVTLITEEISTFIVEILNNDNIEIEQLVGNVSEISDDLRSMFARIFRLCKCNQLSQRNRDYILNMSLNASEQGLISSGAKFLTKLDRGLEADNLKSFNQIMTKESWTFLINELVGSWKQNEKLIAECIHLKKNRAIDLALLKHGAQIYGDDSDIRELPKEFILDVLTDGEQVEVLLIFDLLSRNEVKNSGLALTIIKIVAQRNDAEHYVGQLQSLFMSVDNQKSLKMIRALKISPDVTADMLPSLNAIEKLLKDNHSRDHERKAKPRAKSSTIRELMWNQVRVNAQ